jgi:hypothetical protein
MKESETKSYNKLESQRIKIGNPENNVDVFNVGLLLSQCPQAYVDPNKYGPEKAVRKFAKEIDRREIKLEGLIGEGKFMCSPFRLYSKAVT